MRVTFSTFGHLRRYLPDGRDNLILDLPRHATAGDVLEQLGMTWGEVGVIQVNGRLADEAAELHDGDTVEMFAPVGGGAEESRESREQLIRLLNPLGRLWLRVAAHVLELVTSLSRRRLDVSWVTPSLAVGGAFQRADIRRLANVAVDAVVDLREEAADDAEELARHGLEWLHLPARDAHALAQDQLVTGVEWVRERIGEGKKVLVHCQHGVGRAPLLASAVLVSQGYSAPAALRAIQARRWQAMPNDRQLEALLEFEANAASKIED